MSQYLRDTNQTNYYGLNVCVPSKFTGWNPNTQYVIRRWEPLGGG